MSDANPNTPVGDAAAEHWTARFSRPVIFVILTLIAIGVYLAFTIPVAVFPNTDFPRIVVGIDNGVAPINQMQVMVTRPIEEAMNTVPGLDQVRSTTSRGSGEVNLFFNWNVDMFQTLRVRECGAGASAAVAARHREAHRESSDLRGVSDPGLQPDLRHHVADATSGSWPTTPSSRASTA